MNRSFPLICSLIVALFLAPLTASAQRPTLQFATTVSYAISLPDGRGQPVLNAHTLLALFRLNDDWTLMTRVGFATPFTRFQFMPQAQVGLVYTTSPRTRLGFAALYRYVHDWDNPGNPDAHVVGGGIAPIFLLNAGNTVLAFPIGVTHNFASETWSASFAVEVALKLWP